MGWNAVGRILQKVIFACAPDTELLHAIDLMVVAAKRTSLHPARKRDWCFMPRVFVIASPVDPKLRSPSLADSECRIFVVLNRCQRVGRSVSGSRLLNLRMGS